MLAGPWRRGQRRAGDGLVHRQLRRGGPGGGARGTGCESGSARPATRTRWSPRPSGTTRTSRSRPISTGQCSPGSTRWPQTRTRPGHDLDAGAGRRNREGQPGCRDHHDTARPAAAAARDHHQRGRRADDRRRGGGSPPAARRDPRGHHPRAEERLRHDPGPGAVVLRHWLHWQAAGLAHNVGLRLRTPGRSGRPSSTSPPAWSATAAAYPHLEAAQSTRLSSGVLSRREFNRALRLVLLAWSAADRTCQFSTRRRGVSSPRQQISG